MDCHSWTGKGLDFNLSNSLCFGPIVVCCLYIVSSRDPKITSGTPDQDSTFMGFAANFIILKTNVSWGLRSPPPPNVFATALVRSVCLMGAVCPVCMQAWAKSFCGKENVKVKPESTICTQLLFRQSAHTERLNTPH